MGFLQSLTEKYIFGIKPGMFRLFLAVLVLLHHGLRVFPVGRFAVFAFFILSGYWVSRMYQEFYSKKEKSYLLFLYSRVFRLYPLYLLCTAIMLIVTRFIILGHYNVQLTPTLGFKEYSFMALLLPLNLLNFQLLVPAWSLAVEMQFYLVVPFIMWLVLKVNWKILFVILLLVSTYFSYHKMYKLDESVLAYLVYFFMGMIIYLKSMIVSKKQVLIGLACAAVFILFSYGLPSLRTDLLYKKETFAGISYYDIFNQVLPFFFVPFIIHNLSQKSDKRDRHFGDFSYTLYLVHWIIFSIYYVQYTDAGVTRSKLIGFGITIGATLLVSLLIYLFFEKKVEILRRKLIKSSS